MSKSSNKLKAFYKSMFLIFYLSHLYIVYHHSMYTTQGKDLTSYQVRKPVSTF